MNNYMKVIINALKQWTTDKFSTVDQALENKVDKIEGKGLSTEDFTTDYKEKLDSLTPGSGGATSWNDLTDKPFYEENNQINIEWDGSTEGRDCATDESGTLEAQGNAFYKVSDLILTKEDVIGGTICVIMESTPSELTLTEDMVVVGDGIVSISNILVVFTNTTAVLDGITLEVPSVGCYAASLEQGLVRFESLTCGSNTIHKLDPKFLPEGGFGYEGVGKNVIEWDCNPTEEMQANSFQIYGQSSTTITKLSDLTPTKEDLIGGTFSVNNQSANITEEFYEQMFTEHDNHIALSNAMYIFYDTNYSMGGNQFTAPSTGVYVNVKGTTPVTISYGSVPVIHKIDEKFIPDTIARKSDILAGGSGGVSSWNDLADKPSALPNPKSLTLTGAVNASYDGSEEVVVEIPVVEVPVTSVNGMTGDVVIEIGGSGTSVNPDWNQNDPAQSDFVKNRTHWEENNQTIIEWDGDTEGLEQVQVGELLFYKISDAMPALEDLRGGVLGMLDFLQQGTGYEEIEISDAVIEDFKEMNPDDIAVNCYATTVFLVAFDTEIGIGEYACTLPSAGFWGASWFRKLTYGATVVHTLDEKFIPDTVARKSDIDYPVTSVNGQTGDVVIEVGVSSWNDLLDKPFGDVNSLLVKNLTADDEHVSHFPDNGYTRFGVSTIFIPLEENRKYKVIYNGVEYPDLIAKTYTGSYSWSGNSSLPFIYIGENPDALAEAGKNGQTNLDIGFCIGHNLLMNTILIIGTVSNFNFTVFKCEEKLFLDESFIPDTIVRKSDIPEGLLKVTAEDEGKMLGVVNGEWKPMDALGGTGSAAVQSDWNQNDSTQPDYISNRTHYKYQNSHGCVFSGGYEAKTYDDGIYRISNILIDGDPILGEQYSVYIDGAETRYASYVLKEYASGIWYLGNLSILAPSADNTGEKFMILISNDPHMNGRLSASIYASVAIGYNGNDEHNAYVYGPIIDHSPLDERYIPDTIARVDAPMNSVTLVSPNGTKFSVMIDDSGKLIVSNMAGDVIEQGV